MSSGARNTSTHTYDLNAYKYNKTTTHDARDITNSNYVWINVHFNTSKRQQNTQIWCVYEIRTVQLYSPRGWSYTKWQAKQ